MRGDGSIYQRKDGLWIGSLNLPKHGKDRRRKTVSAKTKSAVIVKLREERKKLEQAGDIPTSSQTLETWLTYWLEKVAPKRNRPNTVDDYRSKLTNHVIPIIGKTRLDKLTPTAIRRVHDAMLDNGLSSTYALNTHRALSKALTDAVRDGRIITNVATRVDAPKQSHVELEPLDVQEAISVIRQAKEALETDPYDPTPVLWTVYLLTANRRGELLGLEWDRVVFDGPQPHIDLSWQLQRIKNIATAPANYEYRNVAGKLFLTRPKTQAGWRTIPLVDPLLTLLREHRDHSPANKHNLVFTTPFGRPIEPSRASDAWAKWRETVTNKSTRLHDLRHTTVDLLYAADVPGIRRGL